MRVVRWWQVLVAAVVGLALGLLVVLPLQRRGISLATYVTWWTPVLLLLGSGVAAWSGWRVRRWVRGSADARHTRLWGPMSALRSARIVALAQAAALGGGVLVGWFAAQTVHIWSRDTEAAAEHRVVLLVATGCALALAASGLIAQRWCRVGAESWS